MVYNAQSIHVLEGLDPVRKRPSMYIGSTGQRGLHHLVWEILDNSIDEHLAGFCDKICVTINKDGSITIQDNGRGIPVDMHGNTRDYPKEKYPNGIVAERLVFTVLHAGGKFDNTSYKVSGGLHGVGSAVVNALSSYLKVEIYKDGKYYVDEYKDGGVPITKLNKGALPVIKNTNLTGTKITFMPDSNIFETIIFKADIIKKRLKEISYLNKGLTIEFLDNTSEAPEKIIFHEDEGIVGFIKDLNKNRDIIHEDIISIEGERSNIEVEVAFQFTTDFSENIFSFCNNINTQEGGTHVTGFKSAFTKIINKYAKDLSLLKGGSFDGKDVRSGLTCVISIKHREPQFEGQTKTKLGNSDVKTVSEEIISEQLELFFDRNLETLNKIIEQATKAYNLRKIETKAKERFLNKSNQLSINSKLASCQYKNDPNKGILTEIFIVEGDSAGGSAKQGRDRKIQAILPLWGKMMNVEKAPLEKIYGNDKLLPVITALGAGIGEDFDVSKVKYDKVIIMADADVDGSHIRTLLLTFFYRHMKALIEQGHVYIAQPPLFKISKGKQEVYAYNEREIDKVLKAKRWNMKDCTMQRYKGLGEMNPEQLWETTMNPETRVLKKIEIDDIIEADNITTILMGSKVPPRREFIENEAEYANVDI